MAFATREMNVNSTAKHKLYSLQVFRGLAALAVVAHHTFNSTAAFVFNVPKQFFPLFERGALGVDFFFVLSGFIIMHAHMGDGRSLASVQRYAFKRLVRIFPAYLPISFLMIALYAIFPHLSGSGGREYSLLSSMFLLPADNPPALSVAWTLVHELLFYVVFLIYFISRRAFFVALFIWGGAAVLANMLELGAIGWSRYPLSLLNIEFMLGVLSALLASRVGWMIKPWLLTVFGGGVALFAQAFMGDDGPSYVRIIFALGIALMIVGVVDWERKVVIRWPSFLLLIGNASYSIYLIHNPLLSFSQRFAGRLELNWIFALALGIFIAISVGCMYHMLIEKPAMLFFQRQFNSKTPRYIEIR